MKLTIFFIKVLFVKINVNYSHFLSLVFSRKLLKNIDCSSIIFITNKLIETSAIITEI